MGRSAAIASVLLYLLGASAPAAAYTPTVTSSGIPVRWKGQIKINLAGNPSNRLGIDAGGFQAAVVRGLQRWARASGGSVGFDYWQGTDRGVFEPASNYDGLSSVYFASNAKGDPHLSANVLGLTQVWYNTDTGEILETDIVLNDRDFRFTTNPQDTSGYGSTAGANYSGGRNNVFIENVITHELGHAYGLSHSGGLQSTMLFMESPEQAHLACDETIGIRAVYPAGDSAARGSIAGAVALESGKPVFGAHVLAISRRRGTVLATAITDRGGGYRIAALEPGAYFLMVEPFFAGASALPSYYSGASAALCGGGTGTFSRSVLMDAAGARPIPVHVPGGGGTASAPTLVARCAAGGAALAASAGSSRSSSAPVVFNGAADGSGFGAVDRLDASNTGYYRLRSVAGRLEIHALSYSLYSPIRPALSLLDANGDPVQSARADEVVYAGESGYVNYDAALVAENLPAGDYIVQVSRSPLDATRYPAGPISLDSVPFLVLTGSVNEAAPPLADQIPDNARCRMNESFAAYSSPGGYPPRRSVEDEGDGTGFCGTVAESSGRSGRGPGPGAMAGWLAPWLAMAMIARIAKAMARAASTRSARRPLPAGALA